MSDAQLARVKVLDADEPCFHAEVSRLKAAQAELVAARPVRPGSLVELEWEDTLILGEVKACRSEGERYALEMRIEHTLRWTRELAELARAVRDAG